MAAGSNAAPPHRHRHRNPPAPAPALHRHRHRADTGIGTGTGTGSGTAPTPHRHRTPRQGRSGGCPFPEGFEAALGGFWSPWPRGRFGFDPARSVGTIQALPMRAAQLRARCSLGKLSVLPVLAHRARCPQDRSWRTRQGPPCPRGSHPAGRCVQSYLQFPPTSGGLPRTHRPPPPLSLQ